MLYLFYGTDTDKVRAKMRGVLEGAKKKREGAEVFRMDSDNFSVAEFEEKISGQGLFEKKFIVIADRILEDKNIAEEVLERLKSVAESENLFLFVEQKLLKPVVAKFEKLAQKVENFELKEKIGKEKFNTFALADALGRRDRKNLWILFRKAVEAEIAPEEISGILFWKIKTMLSANYKQMLSKDELKKLSSELVSIYHDSHRGLCDFENSLERLILSL